MADRQSATVYTPEFGTVRRLLEYGLFVVVVDRSTATLTDMLAGGPMASLAPKLALAAAVALWAMLALTVGREVLRQYRANPRTGDDATELLAQLRPAPRWAATVGAVAVAGGAVVASGWPRFVRLVDDPLAAFELVQRTLAGAPGQSGVDRALALAGTDLVWALAVPVGFVALAYGVDRLLVGGVRELQYRRSVGR